MSATLFEQLCPFWQFNHFRTNSSIDISSSGSTEYAGEAGIALTFSSCLSFRTGSASPTSSAFEYEISGELSDTETDCILSSSLSTGTSLVFAGISFSDGNSSDSDCDPSGLPATFSCGLKKIIIKYTLIISLYQH